MQSNQVLVIWMEAKEHVKGKRQGGKWNEMTVASRWKYTNKLERLIQKGIETKQNYAKKPNRISITWKGDKRKVCDDHERMHAQTEKITKDSTRLQQVHLSATPYIMKFASFLSKPF